MFCVIAPLAGLAVMANVADAGTLTVHTTTPTVIVKIATPRPPKTSAGPVAASPNLSPSGSGIIAQQKTMDDNFFHSAYGGSFLQHRATNPTSFQSYTTPKMRHPPQPCRGCLN
jgi:hypothetical protein